MHMYTQMSRLLALVYYIVALFVLVELYSIYQSSGKLCVYMCVSMCISVSAGRWIKI